MHPTPSVPQTAAENHHDRLLREQGIRFEGLTLDDQERLRAMAADLQERDFPAAFVASGLRSTAQLLAELRRDEQERQRPAHREEPTNIYAREHVRRFVEQHALPATEPAPENFRRERKREERERLHTNVMGLIRQARQARGRHEVKKTRNMLLRIDQREVRRTLGKEGEELCRQINTWLRSTAPMFQN